VNTLYRWWAAIVFLAVVAQVGLAGYGAFHAVDKADDAGEGGSVRANTIQDGFDLHAAVGYLLVIAALLLLGLAYLSARDRRPGSEDRRVRWSGIALGLLILQVLLAWLGSAVPGLGFLHPIGALAIFAVTGMLAHRAWRTRAPGEVPAAV
jgi:drug/metabolite transporter (DMT)-like permease